MDSDSTRRRAGLISRRGVLRLGAVAAGGAAAGGILSACGSGSGGGSGSKLVFLSDQLSQTDESAAMRSQILSGFKGGGVGFTSFSSATPFIDQVIAQSKAGAGTVDVIGGLQGDFVSLAAQIPLRAMGDVISELSGSHFPQEYNGAAIGPTLQAQASTLQSVLQSAGARCWKPDPPSTGVCQVG